MSYDYTDQPQIEELEQFESEESHRESDPGEWTGIVDDYSDDGDALASAGWGTDEDYMGAADY